MDIYEAIFAAKKNYKCGYLKDRKSQFVATEVSVISEPFSPVRIVMSFRDYDGRPVCGIPIHMVKIMDRRYDKVQKMWVQSIREGRRSL